MRECVAPHGWIERRCRRAALLLALVLAVPASQAQRASVAPWMTGERLVKLLADIDPADVTWSPASALPSRQLLAEHITRLNGSFFKGYIEAVHDATEGKEWCFSEKYQPAPLELVMDARHSLQRMSDDQLKRNAADLIVEVWRKKWPCPADQRRKK